uniref:serine C-palmitoyltransferase n=1 Tax=Pseudo-nitzschia australis TaxID=44445 RepID=A0A7S4EHV8_9STRA
MLFPAVHQLGFQVGQAVSNFVYNTATKMNMETVATIRSTNGATLLDAFGYAFLTLPGLYKTWWWNLVAKDPLHVAIETIMLMSIVYMMLSRSTEGYKDNSKDKLNKREQEELLGEWKHKMRAPLAPPASKVVQNNNNNNNNNETSRNSTSTTSTSTSSNSYGYGYGYGGIDVNNDDDFQIVVQKQEGKWLTVTVPDHWITNTKHKKTQKKDTKTATATTTTTTTTATTAGNNSKNDNTHKENNSSNSNSNNEHAITKNTTPPRRAETELKVLNFCNFDFLGFQTSDVLRRASTKALNKYGCGSCGPRGFYGTIDVHLQLEKNMARFCNTDQAILYSDGASACSSTVAAFAKRGDLLVVDEGVYEPLSKGVFLSRANVHWFRHNDVQDLERVLKELQATDRKLGRKPTAQRRFIVVEGLYKNLGTIAPLDKIVALKHEYKYRLILDESFSFGTLGKTGRGVLEEHGKRPMYDAEITTIALENSLGSIGGVTVGNEEVVDHQRLSAAGYCFSASAPPFTSSASVESLRLLEERPELVQRLQSNVKYTYKRLLEKVEEHNTKNNDNHNTACYAYNLVVTSDSRSPIVVLQLERESVYESAIMSGIMRECLQRGVGIVASTSAFHDNDVANTNSTTTTMTATVLAPCIRITVSTLHTKEDTDAAIHALIESAALVTSRYPVLRPPE